MFLGKAAIILSLVFGILFVWRLILFFFRGVRRHGRT